MWTKAAKAADSLQSECDAAKLADAKSNRQTASNDDDDREYQDALKRYKAGFPREGNSVSFALCTAHMSRIFGRCMHQLHNALHAVAAAQLTLWLGQHS